MLLILFYEKQVMLSGASSGKWLKVALLTLLSTWLHYKRGNFLLLTLIFGQNFIILLKTEKKCTWSFCLISCFNLTSLNVETNVLLTQHGLCTTNLKCFHCVRAFVVELPSCDVIIRFCLWRVGESDCSRSFSIVVVTNLLSLLLLLLLSVVCLSRFLYYPPLSSMDNCDVTIKKTINKVTWSKWLFLWQ